MQAETLTGGFAHPALDAALAFRAVMEAMARPGTIQKTTGATAPAPVSQAAGCVLLTLCDANTPIYLAGASDTPEVRQWIAFHTGAPFSGPATCHFALGTWDDLMPLSQYPIGTPEYPDRSTTLIVETGALSQEGATLQGPGIETSASLALPDVAILQANHRHFPLGCDFIFTAGGALAALPRSTEVS